MKAPIPPKGLGKAATARWRAIAGQLGPKADLPTLATYCQVWARWRDAEEAIAKSGQLTRGPRGQVVASPLLNIAKQASAEVRTLERRLGIGGPAAAGAGALERQDDGPWLTRRQLATALGVHMMTVTKWERDGMPRALGGSKGRPSLYDEAAVRGWRDTREAEARSSTGIVDVAKQRARKELAQATLAEQTFEMRRRELLPKAEVEKIWSAEQTAVRAKLLAIPTAYADRVHRAGTLEGVTGVEQALKEAIYDALRELADPDREPSPPATPTGERAAA